MTKAQRKDTAQEWKQHVGAPMQGDVACRKLSASEAFANLTGCRDETERKILNVSRGNLISENGGEFCKNRKSRLSEGVALKSLLQLLPQ